MPLVRTLPRLGGLPELRTYECRPCGIVFTEAEDHVPSDEVRYFIAQAV